MKELKQLGLTENEINVYLAILRQGVATIKSLTSTSGVKRTTIYSCLTKLKKLGLITEGKEKKKRVFLPEAPEKLFEEIDKKRKIAESIVPQIKAFTKKTSDTPKVRFYEGKAAYWNMIDDYLQEKKDFHGILSAIEHFKKIKTKDFIERVARRRRQIGKTKAYYITDKESAVVKDYFRQETDFAEYRFFPNGFKPSAGLGVYGNKIIFFSPEEPIWGMIIESKEIAEVIKFMWDNTWKNLEGKNLPEKRLKPPEFV